MTLPTKETGPQPSLVDLFDLPSDAPDSVWSEPEDAPPARAPADRSHSAPHGATPTAAAAGDGAEDARHSLTDAALRIRPLSWLWIGLGIVVAVNVVALTLSFSFRGAPAPVHEESAVAIQPAVAEPLVEPEVAQAVTPRGPPVPTDHSALIAARAALRAAEAELTAGRRAVARARLGRLLLEIDAVEPREREVIHASAALLVARSLQADADAARSLQSGVDAVRRSTR